MRHPLAVQLDAAYERIARWDRIASTTRYRIVALAAGQRAADVGALAAELLDELHIEANLRTKDTPK